MVLETDTYDGHRVKEELLAYANKLEYKQIFDSFILTKKLPLQNYLRKKLCSSSSRNSGWAILINDSARFFKEAPRKRATPNSVTT